MNQLTKILAVAESVLLIITSSCKKDLADNRVTDQNNAIARAKSVQPSLQSQLMTGLGGGLGQYNRPWWRFCLCPMARQAQSYALTQRPAIIQLLPVDYRS